MRLFTSLRHFFHHALVSCVHWCATRTLGHTFDTHHRIMHAPWYPFVVQQVRAAERTHSSGDHKRTFVVAAVRARFQAKQLPCPTSHDIHLAIEYAVRDHAH